MSEYIEADDAVVPNKAGVIIDAIIRRATSDRGYLSVTRARNSSTTVQVG
jgi:hypothetical protein